MHKKRLIVLKQMRKKALVHVEEGDTLRTMLSMLKKLTRHTPINVVGKKREIAKAVIAEKKFVV